MELSTEEVLEATTADICVSEEDVRAISCGYLQFRFVSWVLDVARDLK